MALSHDLGLSATTKTCRFSNAAFPHGQFCSFRSLALVTKFFVMRTKTIVWRSLPAMALSLGTAGSLFLQPLGAAAQVGVTFSAGIEISSPQDFYDPLAGYGAWFDLPPYGRVWQPAEVDPAWRPYTVGHWEWTDVGRYWVSDEPWAWATYHYGSWVYDPTYAWLWIPGTQWAPAWVIWREGPQYIGWAPCGPGGIVLAPSLFVFVGIGHFHDPLRPGAFIVNNPTIIERTRVINHFHVVDHTFDGGVHRRVMMNDGPRVNVIEQAAGTRFTAQPVRQVVSREPVPSTIRRRSSDLNIQRPPLQAAPTERSGNYRERQPVRRAQQNQTEGADVPNQQSAPSSRQ